jgi:hypothetical protein
LEHHAVGIVREPTPDGYHLGWSAFPGETIAPLAFPDASIPVADIAG